MKYLEVQAWRKLEGSLKDYCFITIVKEEVDREYRNRVLAQDISLYLNNILYLYLNMVQYIVFEYGILYIIYWIYYLYSNANSWKRI
jgi:hypothetical protein